MKNGFETRYDNDGGGNHIERCRNEYKGYGKIFHDFSHRACTSCKRKMPTKDGAGIGKKFICFYCKNRLISKGEA